MKNDNFQDTDKETLLTAKKFQKILLSNYSYSKICHLLSVAVIRSQCSIEDPCILQNECLLGFMMTL